MTQAPSIKEALERSIVAIDDWLNVYASELCNQDRVDEANHRISNAGGTLAYIANVQQQNRAALATLQPSGERRDSRAEFEKAWANRPWNVGDETGKDRAFRWWSAALASGLVQDEAGIRADEREKCAKIADLFVNHDAEYGAKYPDEAFKFDNRWLRSKTIADAIRSARDGGEG